MITPRYLTDARHGISSPVILKFQSGSLVLYYKALHLAGDNLSASCITLVSIIVNDHLFVHNMSSLMGPHGLPDYQYRRSFVLCYPGSVGVVD